jgi:dolichyl-phosphate beta-glucosyltransferase
VVTARPPEGQRSTLPATIEIVVPARNESRRLPGGLAELCRKAASLPLRTAILVVDSASTDLTGDVVRAWPPGPVPVSLLRCHRAGKGRAVRAGLLATTAPFVGFCDADMATDLAALDVAIRLLAAGNPVVIGSRLLARQVVPGATDTQCGFKFFAGPLVRAAALSLRTAGFAFDLELIARCQRMGATLTEIPVYWRDMPGSTFSVSRHSAATFREVATIWLRLRTSRGPDRLGLPTPGHPQAGLRGLPPSPQADPAGPPAPQPPARAWPAGITTA